MKMKELDFQLNPFVLSQNFWAPMVEFDLLP